MAYKYVVQSTVKDADEWCKGVILEVQDIVRDWFTFDFKLIGSGERRLVTQNGNNPFDLDYNLILQKDKKDLFYNPQRIKILFMDAFKRALNKRGIKNYSERNHTSVITVNILDKKNNVEFSFDVAILAELDNGFFCRLTYDKISNRYIWNQVPNSHKFFDRYKLVRDNGYFMKFKNRYLELKKEHLEKKDETSSFSIFLETLNEFKL